VCQTDKIITDQPEAIEFGKKAKAAVVIWGRSDEALYEVNIEIAEWDLPEYEWRPFPVSEAKSSEFQMKEPSRTGFLTEFILSQLLYLRGDTSGARDLLSEALSSEQVDELKQNPDNLKDLADAYFLLGYFYDSDTNMAIKYYSKALDLDNTLYPAYINRGKAYEQNEQPELALEDYKKVVLLTKDSEPDVAAKALINLAWLYANIDQAIAEGYFTEAIALDPVKGYPQRGQARLFRWQQKKQAIEDFSEALKLEKTDPYLYHFLGKAQLINNQPEDAIQTYENAISAARWEPDDRDIMIDELRLLADGLSPELRTAIEEIVNLLKSADLP
jgi:tetratricopeptide (TPR) repeat protein